MVVRFVNDWLIKECLIRFELLAKTLSREEIAPIDKCIIHKISISLELVVAAMRDCASTNNVAMHTVKGYWMLIHWIELERG